MSGTDVWLLTLTVLFLGALVLFADSIRGRALLPRTPSGAAASSNEDAVAQNTAAMTALTETLTRHNDLLTQHNDLQTRATAALEAVASLLEQRAKQLRELDLRSGASSHPASNGPASATTNNNNSSNATATATDDADLYRRKVEAMEGLARILENQPGAIGQGEDEGLYRKRVEALEGLRRVLEAQPPMSVSERGRNGGRGDKRGETLADLLLL